MAVITDSIAERTAGAGVTVDGLLIKDGLLPDVTPADIGAEAAGAAATAVSGHESTYDHSNIPGVDEAAALTAYQSALAVAAAGQVLTASGPGAAAFAAAAGAVNSVNGKTGAVVLNAADVGALPAVTFSIGVFSVLAMSATTTKAQVDTWFVTFIGRAPVDNEVIILNITSTNTSYLLVNRVQPTLGWTGINLTTGAFTTFL